MMPDRNSPEYQRSAAQAKQMLTLMQACFINMQVCMRMNNEIANGYSVEKITELQNQAAKRVQDTFSRFLDNDGHSPGFKIITEISKALSEEFVMDYFTEYKKNEAVSSEK